MDRRKKKHRVQYILRPPEEGHRLGVNVVKVNQAGNRIFTGGRDGTIRCWRPPTSGNQFVQENVIEAHCDWVNDLCLTNNDSIVVSCASDCSIRAVAFPSLHSSTALAHKDYVKCLSYSPEKNLLVSTGLDGELLIWDCSVHFQPLASLGQSPSSDSRPIAAGGDRVSMYSLAINKTGNVIAAGSSSKTLRLWDARDGKLKSTLNGHTDNIRAVLLNDEGTMCVSGSSDDTIRVWDLRQQKCVNLIAAHDDSVWSLASSNNFEKIYSGGRDCQIFCSDLTTGESVLCARENSPVLSICVDSAHNFMWAATDNSTISQWPCNISSSEWHRSVKIRHSSNVGISHHKETNNNNRRAAAIAPDVALTNDPVFKEKTGIIPGQAGIRRFQILEDKRRVVTETTDGKIEVWDIAKCERVSIPFPSPDASPTSFVSSPQSIGNKKKEGGGGGMIESSTTPSISSVSSTPSPSVNNVQTANNNIAEKDNKEETDQETPNSSSSSSSSSLSPPLSVSTTTNNNTNNNNNINLSDPSLSPFDAAILSLKQQVVVPSWCNIDKKMGCLSVALEPPVCFAAQLYGVDGGLEGQDVGVDEKINIGYNVLRSLFKGWRNGKLKRLEESVGAGIGGDEEAEEKSALQDDGLEYPIPPTTAVFICNENNQPMLMKYTGGLEGKPSEILPAWLVDVLTGRDRVPDPQKMSFYLVPHPSSQMRELATSKLIAPPILRAAKVRNFVISKLEIKEVPAEIRGDDSPPLPSEEYIELLCNDRPLPLTMNLVSAKKYLSGKPSEDLVIQYRWRRK